MKDITYRAVEVLAMVDFILAEDTRTSGILLKSYSITTPMVSFHAFNEHQKVSKLVEEVGQGKNIALISDAGTPGISDPGFLLIREAVNRDLKLEVLPGATAFLPALLKSGFPTDKFVFEGFLPHKKGRKTRLESLVLEKRTTIFYESPHRLLKTLTQMKAFIGEERSISVSRELTKKFEETITGSVHSLILHFETHPPKGEFVIIVSGND